MKYHILPALIKLFSHVFHGEGLFNGTKLIVRTLLYRIKSLAKIKMITKSMKVKKYQSFTNNVATLNFIWLVLGPLAPKARIVPSDQRAV